MTAAPHHSPFDLSSPEFIANPYPTYQQLLEDAPIYWCEDRQFYYVSRHAYVAHIFRDPRASSNRVKPMVSQLSPPEKEFISPLVASLSKWLLFLDPPKHTPLRKLINQSLSARIINEMAPAIQQLVNELIDGFYDKNESELIAEFSYPLPVLVISDLLGIPIEDREKIKHWSDILARFLGEKTEIELTIQAKQAVLEMEDFFQHVLTNHRQHNTSRLMEQLLLMQAQDPDFSDKHLVANCILLVFAGHETTRNSITNAYQTLLKHPQQLQQLRNNPTLLDQAIEECLRYESPVQRMGRLITEPMSIDDYPLLPGRRALMMVGAANRDPHFVDTPNSFDISRPTHRHLAFGHGIHLCSGAALARLETKIAIKTLIERLPNARLLDDTPTWQYNLGLRMMEHCRIAIAP